ncbi:MAG: transglutaminase-like domain-containing protein [Cytophagales bacterium]|nr:transglutaminase-like domain-containing protein [Cytophagales bacterium]
MKQLKYYILSFLLLFIVFSLWISPSLGGLIPGGKEIPDKTITKIEFDVTPTLNFNINYESQEDEEKLIKLRNSYHLDSLIKSADNDFEKILIIQSWVQSRWAHDGNSSPEKNDALFILQEAEKGKKFRCVEYSLVTRECLQSLGFKIRSIGLMTRDVNEVNYGAGHVANEVYLKDLKKWAFIDPQFDVIVAENGIPLNAVELQYHIANNIPFEVSSPNNVITKEGYIEWIGPYLFYFQTSLNKGSLSILDRIIGTKKQLTLVPKGNEEPKYFQRLFRINNSYFTNSVGDFYPIIE